MKDAPRFLWAANAPRDPKVLRLRARLGNQGYGAFQILVCMMREEGAPYSLELDDLEIHAMALNESIEFTRSVIEACVDVGLFVFETEEGKTFFFAPALRKGMEEWDSKKQRRSDAARLSRQRTSTSNASENASNAQASNSNGAALLKTPIQYNPIQDNTKQDNTRQSIEQLVSSVLEDQITTENVLMQFLRVGLTAEDIPRAGQLVARAYANNPTLRRNPAFDLSASWVIQELLKEKNEAAKLKNTLSRNQAPPEKTRPRNDIELKFEEAKDGTMTVVRTKKSKGELATASEVIQKLGLKV